MVALIMCTGIRAFLGWGKCGIILVLLGSSLPVGGAVGGRGAGGCSIIILGVACSQGLWGWGLGCVDQGAAGCSLLELCAALSFGGAAACRCSVCALHAGGVVVHLAERRSSCVSPPCSCFRDGGGGGGAAKQNS